MSATSLRTIAERAARPLREWIERAVAIAVARAALAFPAAFRPARPLQFALTALLRQLLESRALLVAGALVLRSWIAMLAARPPLTRPPLARRAPIGHRFFARLKHLAALEPDDARIGLLALQLLERRQQVFPVASAKRSRLPARDDRPVSGP
jgi:hypothetical protein